MPVPIKAHARDGVNAEAYYSCDVYVLIFGSAAFKNSQSTSFRKLMPAFCHLCRHDANCMPSPLLWLLCLQIIRINYS